MAALSRIMEMPWARRKQLVSEAGSPLWKWEMRTVSQLQRQSRNFPHWLEQVSQAPWTERRTGALLRI